MSQRDFLLALGSSVGLALGACGGDDASGGACTPGQVEACACPGGGQGAQACTADGNGYGPCDCSGTTSVGESSGGETTLDPSTSGTGTTDPTDPTDPTGVDTGTTTGNGGTVMLINDGFVNNAPVVFHGGFFPNECWGSTFVPEPEHYPFLVTHATVLIGSDDPNDLIQQPFSVGIYNVDDSNMPTTEIAGTEVALTGAVESFNVVDFAAVMVTPPMIDSGNFAIVMCHTAHDGPPSIANDLDGTNNGDLNWLKPIGEGWVQSQSLLVSGDWILRATISLQ